jgi:hypothetical protein
LKKLFRLAERSGVGAAWWGNVGKKGQKRKVEEFL